MISDLVMELLGKKSESEQEILTQAMGWDPRDTGLSIRRLLQL